jgi:hypothetical protein
LNPFIGKRLRALVPVFVQPVEGLPPADADQVVSFVDEFLGTGLPEFRPVYYLLILTLNGLCLLRRGRSLARLDPDGAVDFLESLYRSRLAGLRAIPSVLGMPIYMAHYERDEIQPLLGFDIEALRREAAERGVER